VEIIHGMSPLTTIEQVLRKQVNTVLREIAVAFIELKSFDDMVVIVVNVFVIFFNTANVILLILCQASAHDGVHVVAHVHAVLVDVAKLPVALCAWCSWRVG
jgi:hypothetical protein